jgi:hypothetical protein
VQERPSEAAKVDLRHVNLGSVWVDVIVPGLRLAVVYNVALFERLPDRLAVAGRPTFPAETSVGGIIIVFWGDGDEPG